MAEHSDTSPFADKDSPEGIEVNTPLQLKQEYSGTTGYVKYRGEEVYWTAPSGENYIVSELAAVWGQIYGELDNQTDLKSALDGKSDVGHTHTKSEIGLSDVLNAEQIPKSIGTAKGDIIVYSGDNSPIVVHIDTDGKVLMADSTTASGVKWGAQLASVPWGTKQTGVDIGTLGEMSMDDDYLYVCTATGSPAEWKRIPLLLT